MDAQHILRFWFDELTPQQHFARDLALDALMRERFGSVLEAGARGELWAWRATTAGRLAEIVLLDQFSRNIHRDTPRAFAQDPVALVLAQELVATGRQAELPQAQRRFVYMPYMHSESLTVHDQALRLFAEAGMEDNLRYEHQHRAIIERFGRYPHRNAVLGRVSTPDEQAFLSQPGSSF